MLQHAHVRVLEPCEGTFQARTLAPAIIFIDEIDAVGRVRGGAMGNDERDQTLNQVFARTTVSCILKQGLSPR